MRVLIFIILLSSLIYCIAQGQTYTYDFSIDDQGFVGGVADFSVEMSSQHQFTFDNRPLPSPLPTNQHAQYFSGFNPSDDLFMFMKRHITDLQPNTTYDVTFDVEFASIYPTNAIGVGGAPGEGVTMKAGLTLVEPDTLIVDKGGPFVKMNIDKGNQSTPGPDMDTIGHVGVSDTTTVYTLKTNSNDLHPFRFTTDNSGQGWLIVGTDSGFESATSLYFTSITAQFNIFTKSKDVVDESKIKVYPNPAPGTFLVESLYTDLPKIKVFDEAGHLVVSKRGLEQVTEITLKPGLYFVQVAVEDGTAMRKVLVE